MLEVPRHRFPQAGFERMARRPPELAPNRRCVDRVAPIVSGTVRHEGLQTMRARHARTELVDEIADAIPDFDVRPLVAAADIILFADAPLRRSRSAARVRHRPARSP